MRTGIENTKVMEMMRKLSNPLLSANYRRPLYICYVYRGLIDLYNIFELLLISSYVPYKYLQVWIYDIIIV